MVKLSHRDLGKRSRITSAATPPLFFFLIRALLQDRRDIARLIKIMAWSTSMAALLTWWAAIEKGPRSSIEASRVSGIFNGPNEMGTFLVYSSMMMLAVVVWRTSLFKKVVYLGAFLLAARAMLFTFSRGAYVSLAAGSILILLLRNPFYLAGAAVVGTAAVAVDPGLIPESVIVRLGETTKESAGDMGEPELDKSVSHRASSSGAPRASSRTTRSRRRSRPLSWYVDTYVERPGERGQRRSQRLSAGGHGLGLRALRHGGAPRPPVRELSPSLLRKAARLRSDGRLGRREASSRSAR
jgi:hypothetical protein